MANKKIYELEELTTPVSDDLLLINQSSTSKDKKVKMSNLISNDTIESAVDAWLDDHPEATTTVEDGSITPAKLHQDTLDMFDEKADIDGYYEDMSVGSAEQLLSNTYEEDSAPYLYRTSGGSLEIGDRVYEDAIVGGSVAWNQLVQNGNFASSSNWSTKGGTTFSVSDNVASITFGEDSISGLFSASMPLVQNHKYLLLAEAKSNDTGTVTMSLTVNGGNVSVPYINFTPTSSWGEVYAMGTLANAPSSTQSANGLMFRRNSASSFSVDVRNVRTHDLTIMFGSTIADYAYTLETSEAGSGIAWLKSQGFFTKDYYAYNAGGIESVKTSAKKVVGFNQWDEQWETGYYSTTTGEKINGVSNIRCKNPIHVVPKTSYYLKWNNSNNAYINIQFRDANGDFISNSVVTVPLSFNIPNNCYYITFYYTSGYGTIYKNDTCLNFHWDGERDGEYEAYEEKTYPLDSDLELRGIPKLVDGKIKYDGDTYASDGTVTRKYGIVDLGSLEWVYDATYNRFNSQVSGIKKAGYARAERLVCTKYTVISDRRQVTEVPDKSIYQGTFRDLSVHDTAYTDAATFKTAMSGVYLVYELETPTTESADPYTSPQLVDNWGTEEFVDTRDVPVPVGHDSRYLPDLKAKTESAPNNPSTDGLYFLQYQNGEATYVPVPSEVPEAPSEDGTYVLKATVSGGTATLAWVAES